GTLIIENGGGIDGMSIGFGAVNPRLVMSPTGRLVVRSLPGLGDGTGPTPGEFAINQASAGNPWDLTSLNTNGTIEYAATALGIQNVTPFTYNVLEINRPIGSYTVPTTFTNPNVATGNLTIDTLRLFRGILRLTNVNSSIVRNHTIGTLEIGSSGSSSTTSGTNTGIFVNSHNNDASSTLTITGNTTVNASATGGVAITVVGGITSLPTFGPTTLTFEGNLTTSGSSVLQLAVNAAIGLTVPTLNLRDTVQLSSGSRINLNPSGTVGALVNLGGSAPMLFDVQPVSLLGTPPSSPANARGSYVIVASSEVVLPNGAAIAVMNPGTFTVNGTLICQNGSELISTLTGSGSGGPTLTMGTNGTIRVADVDGLGDGTILDPTSDFPLFIRRTSPGSGTPGNWNLASINTAGTIEYNGTGQTVTPRNAPNNYFNLAFSGSGGKTLDGDVDVSNELLLNGGVVSTGTNLLRVNPSGAGAITRTAGHINGRLQRAYPNLSGETRFFPVGDATAYRPISIRADASATVPLEVRLVSGDANALAGVTSPLERVSFARYYEATNNSAFSDDITLTRVSNMQVSTDDGVSVPGDIRVATRTTGNWAPQGGSISSVPNPIESDVFSETLTPTSQLFVALGSVSTDNPLPVQLLSFTGTSTVQGVKLAWETASESESNGFTILRRQQGESEWSEVASYQTAANLRAQNALNGASYSYTDNTLLEVGKSYDYQLRETGFDGQVATLETVTLTIRFNTARAFELAQNYPNPFNPTTTIRYQIPTAETVSLKVYDVLGKEVATLVNGRQEAGSYNVPFNAAGLSSGVYFYRLQAGGFVETKKMLLVK
ncbi:MAG: T9SS type A sorting domain-containing protein, partial [Chloroherpetonaceae bacterium]